MERELVAVGRIIRSVGIRGEVRVEPLTDRSDRFRELRDVWAGADAHTARRCVLSAVRYHDGKPVVRFEDVTSRTDADTLRGWLIFIDASSVPEPEPGNYYVDDILGLVAESEEGEVIGTITDIQTLPAGDVWCLSVQGREVMIPAVREFIRRVDLQERKVVIRVIEGLLD